MLVTLKPHRYAGKLRKVGDKYEASNKSDARLARALGWVEDAPVEQPAPVVRTLAARPRPAGHHAYYDFASAPAPVTRDETAEAAPPATDDSVQPKPKRAYRRRDLTAEE